MDYLLNNTLLALWIFLVSVLNLIINGLPSKPKYIANSKSDFYRVLNLIINGLPSKPTTIIVQQNQL